jgi:hypothetical protein
VTTWHSIDEAKKLAYFTLPEKTNLTETLDALRQLALDERLGADFGILVDVQATNFIPTAGEARTIAALVSDPELLLRHPIAVVVSQTVQYGIGNMVSLIAGIRGTVLRAFYKVEQAEAWLQTHRRE